MACNGSTPTNFTIPRQLSFTTHPKHQYIHKQHPLSLLPILNIRPESRNSRERQRTTDTGQGKEEASQRQAVYREFTSYRRRVRLMLSTFSNCTNCTKYHQSLTWTWMIRYTLLTLFTKYGTITSLDYLFHKTGPMRGKPRGFAFVEFADQSVGVSSFLVAFSLPHSTIPYPCILSCLFLLVYDGALTPDLYSTYRIIGRAHPSIHISFLRL